METVLAAAGLHVADGQNGELVPLACCGVGMVTRAASRWQMPSVAVLDTMTYSIGRSIGRNGRPGYPEGGIPPSYDASGTPEELPHGSIGGLVSMASPLVSPAEADPSPGPKLQRGPHASAVSQSCPPRSEPGSPRLICVACRISPQPHPPRRTHSRTSSPW